MCETCLKIRQNSGMEGLSVRDRLIGMAHLLKGVSLEAAQQRLSSLHTVRVGEGRARRSIITGDQLLVLAVHYATGGDENKTTLCPTKGRRLQYTEVRSEVTCRRCLALMLSGG
jgi:hypothetical protein